MFRRSHILTTAAILAVCAAPAAAMPVGSSGVEDTVKAGQDLRSPDASDAAAHRGLYERPDGPYALNRDYGSPDTVDAARELPPVQIPAPVVEVRDAPVGFDWGDAGIGAAGMLALFSIACGSALLLTARRRRGGFRVASH